MLIDNEKSKSTEREAAAISTHTPMMGEYVGLEAVDDGMWDVYFGVKKLGRLHERHMRIEDHMGRFRRCA